MTSYTAFLDRDGVLNQKAPDGRYISRPEDVVLIPRAAPAVRRLNDSGVLVVVVTNQRGIGRGVFSAEEFQAVMYELERQLGRWGAHLDHVFVCPHLEYSCGCRKPRPGLLLDAARQDPRIVFSRSFVVGDSESDIAAGQALGVPGWLVGGTAPAGTSAQDDINHAADLHSAVEEILTIVDARPTN